jgi:hypothetical protein
VFGTQGKEKFHAGFCTAFTDKKLAWAINGSHFYLCINFVDQLEWEWEHSLSASAFRAWFKEKTGEDFTTEGLRRLDET